MNDSIETLPPKNDSRVVILGLYSVLILSLIGQIIPVIAIQIGCALLLLILLAVAGHLRRKNQNGDVHDHAVYLIRTIWIWSFILMLGLGVTGYYASTLYTYDDFLMIAQSLAAGETDTKEVQKFGMLGLAATIPSLLYIGFRLSRGIWHTLRGTRLPHPKTMI